MKEIAKNQSVVVIVREKAHYGCSKLHYGDFDSPYLAMFVPAIKEEDGSYTDLRTGNKIELAKNDEAWVLILILMEYSLTASKFFALAIIAAS